MIRSIISLLLLLSTPMAYCQEFTPASPPRTYREISRSQKTAAFILLGVGSTMIAVAAPGNVSFDVLPILAVGGSAAVLGSIPLFIAAGKNKRKARAVTASWHVQHPPVVYRGPRRHPFPAVTVRLNL